MRPTKKRGFTLIEMLVSVTLLTFVMLGLLAFIPAARQATDRQRGQTVATNLARATLEDLRRKGFDDTSLDVTGSAVTSVVTIQNFRFSTSYVVSWVDPATGDAASVATDLKQVIVTITGAGRTKGISMRHTTLVGKS